MKKNISPLKVVHPNHFTLTLKVDISWNAKKGYIIWLSYMQWKRRQTPSDTVSTQDVMTKHKSGFINFKDQKSEPMYREEIHFFFQNIPNKPIISISFFFSPTNSWELRHIRWHEMTLHLRPCGSCDNRPPTSKSSLDQTTASCTVAKKQSPKYVYPRREH